MKNDILNEATSFLQEYYEELNQMNIVERKNEVYKEIATYGTYRHTREELIYGAKVAWRNSNRCIGRLFWEQLHVMDKRHLTTEEDIINALFDHIDYATNKGRIRPTITVFAPEIHGERVRIHNHQLIRYAGYSTENGTIGDPFSVDFTNYCITLGWEPKYGNFDVLPLVIQIGDRTPMVCEIPKTHVLEVPIRHPQIECFQDLDLKWYAIPFISSMKLEIGGIVYTAAPFNGWYMGTEIGARNFADESRYNILPKVATILGLDTHTNTSLWKDRALVELNIAVLYSFKESGVSIVDHHTAAQQFKKFEEIEHGKGRSITGRWSWLIPPMAPATTHIFHNSYMDKIKKPNYFY